MRTEAATMEQAAIAKWHTIASYGAAQRIISGVRFRLAGLRVRWRILQLVWGLYGRAGQSLRVLRGLDAARRQVLGPMHLRKFAIAGGRYYYDMYTPGYPSAAFDAYIRSEAARIIPSKRQLPGIRFTNIIMAITKKCTLQCEHCFEWDALNGREQLSGEDLRRMVGYFQEGGVAQMQLSGGEPMLRYNDLVATLQSARSGTDFWLLTSGYRLDAPRAAALKAAGLCGVSISLDHYDPELHNAFRGFRNAYEWVETAVVAAKEVGLVVALSLCVTRAMATEAQLMQYADLARRLGVAIIQVLEPKATGHYAGKNVALSKKEEAVLEAFYLRMNYDAAYRPYPIVTYHGYYQRRIGCFGAGDRHLYVDTNGDMHPCPFCRKACGNVLRNPDEGVAALQASGCHDFSKAAL